MVYRLYLYSCKATIAAMYFRARGAGRAAVVRIMSIDRLYLASTKMDTASIYKNKKV
jgi:hypothetical protein